MTELQTLKADLQQLTNAVGHDLSQPLTTIAGFAGLLAKRYRDELGADGQDYVQFISTGTKQMQAMIEALVCYLGVGQEELPSAWVDCSRVVRSVLGSIDARLGESGASVVVDELPPVRGDAREFELISNAIRFAETQPPRIEVSATHDEDSVRFSVRDNGQGVDPAFTERIFELFQRLHPYDVPGTGAGLAICKKIVERHGGQIWVEPAAGGGSDFLFTIPAAHTPN